MKNIYILLSFLAIGFIGIASCHCNMNTLVGNGKVVSIQRPLPPFSAITIKGVFNVVLCPTTAQEHVEVTTDENLQPEIITQVDNKTLEISGRKNWGMKSEKLEVRVFLKNINQLDIAGVGQVTCCDTLRSSELYLNSTGVGEQKLILNVNLLRASIKSIGEITLTGRCKKAIITNKSIGRFDASELTADSISINHQGVGEAFIRGEKSISIHSSAIGKLTYTGSGHMDKLETTGMGKVDKN